MRRLVTIVCLLGLVVTSFVMQSASAVINLTLTTTFDLSLLATPLPDPMGLSYDSVRDRLLVTDSEVEEFQAPYWHGANFFELTRSGLADRTINISTKGEPVTSPNPLGGYTDEPADVAYANAPFGASEGDHYFITDDNTSRLYDVTLGTDGLFDTNDTRTFFKTHAMGQDVEGLGFGMVGNPPEPNLFFAMGEGPPAGTENGANIHQIYRLQPGPNGRFDGPAGLDYPLSDDIVTNFDTCKPTDTTSVSTSSPCTNPINQPDPEDVAYDSVTGHLFFTSHHTVGTSRIIVTETTVDGIVVDTWDLGARPSGFSASGIAIGRASGGGATSRSIYITSRGVDNDSNPTANDGKIFEWQISGPINHAPSITNPGNRSSNEGFAVTPIQVQVTDFDPGDTFTVSVTGLPAGVTYDADTRTISGSIPYGGWTGTQSSRQHTVVIGAVDQLGAASSASFTWTILRDLTPPAMPASLTVSRQTTGISLDWPENTESDLAGYKVSRATSPTGTYTDLTPTPLEPGNSIFVDDAAPAGVMSYYKVTAIDRAIPPNASAARTGSARRSKIQLVSSSSATATGLLLPMPKPDGVQPGDVLVAGVAARDAALVVAPPGWTLGAQTNRLTALAQQVVYTHTVAAGDPASYTFIVIGRGAAAGVVTAYRGAVERPSAVAGQVNAVSDLITAPSVTPALNDSVYVGFFGIDTEADISAPAGTIVRGLLTAFMDPLGLTFAVADTVIDASPSGARTAAASVAAENVGQAVVLSPAP